MNNKSTENKITSSKIFSRLFSIIGLTLIFTLCGWGAQAPVMWPDNMSATITTNTANGTSIVDVNATDVDGDPLTYSITSGNGSGAFAINSSTGIITVYDKTQLTVQTYTLGVRVADGTSSGPNPRIDTGTVTIIVTAAAGNQAPIANNKNYAIDINSSLTGNIILDSPADSDPDDDNISINDHNSSFTIQNDGNFTFTPASDFCGVYSFDYNITDGSLVSNTATITISVENTLTPTDDYFVTGVNTSLTNNVLSNDDANYTVYSNTSPSNGTLTMDSNGTFTYTPSSTFNGQDTFEYTVTDGTCSVGTATVTVTVTNMCANAIEYNLCSGSISPEPTITAGDPVVYYFTLPADAILELNLTNTGNKELAYDFQQANCGALFAGDTTSYLPQGDAINILKAYPADTYYIGFDVGQVSTTIDLSICYDTNLSGGGGSYVNTSVGVNERNIDYGTDKNITTKIVNKPFGLRTSYLDDNDNVTTYDGTFGNGKTVDMSVILALADDNCNQPTPNEVIGQTLIAHNTSYTDQAADAMTIDYAAQIRRIAMTSFDFGNLFRQAAGLNCANSSLQSSLCLVPACFNSSDNIKAVFPPAFYPNVNVCVNGDGTPGTLAPCDSNAYYGNCGGKKNGTISPIQYNIDLGCAACLADAFEGEPCSRDNFAIRPKNFDVNISDGDVFISGNPTNLKFEAPDWNDVTPTTNYNEVEDSSFAVDINFTDLTKNCPVTIELEGPVQFSDGIDTDNFYFTDVGKDLNFTISEINGTEFAVVDVDDTNDTDRFISPFERNISIIPDRFVIEANMTDHNTDNNFTYLHNTNYYENDDNYTMAAALTIDIKTMGADNNITRNYMETCYAEETNLTLTLNGTNITYPGPVQPQPLNHFLYYNPVEDNGSVDSGEGNYTLPTAVGTNSISFSSLRIENIASTFTADAPDGNGTAYIEYKLNFDRKEHLVVNPFRLILSDVNITDTDSVEGTTGALTGQQATLQYARSRSSKFFYEDISTQAVNTPIMIDVYCGLSFTACDNLSIDTVNAQINEVNWWLSLGHDQNNQDGNITLMKGAVVEGVSADWSVTPTAVNITTNATDPNIDVNRGNNPTLPLTVEIELDETNARDTDHWLIYNKGYPMPLSPFYKVRFIGTSGWSGHGDTGHVVDSNTSIKKHRRLGW